MMKSLFDDNAYTEIKGRLDKLTTESQRQWGSMSVAQMLAHCNIPIESALGKLELPKSGNWFIRLLFKPILYNDKPFGKSLPTDKNFVIKDDKNFDAEKQRLQKNIQEAYDKNLKGAWLDHPSFGKFTPEQHGKCFYKHLDHHLKQFGV